MQHIKKGDFALDITKRVFIVSELFPSFKTTPHFSNSITAFKFYYRKRCKILIVSSIFLANVFMYFVYLGSPQPQSPHFYVLHHISRMTVPLTKLNFCWLKKKNKYMASQSQALRKDNSIQDVLFVHYLSKVIILPCCL